MLKKTLKNPKVTFVPPPPLEKTCRANIDDAILDKNYNQEQNKKFLRSGGYTFID